MPTYEMLWDCSYCGTKKLLGKTHRFCPKCGAPQDAEKRYFPEEPDRVAVEGHEYVGADRECSACGSAMNARAAHCTQCGASMEQAKPVRPLSKSATMPLMFKETQKRPPAPRGCGPRVLAVVGGGLVVLVVGLLALVFWRRNVDVKVVGHSWERVVAVEVFGPQRDQAWCDELPKNARDVTRSREVRSHRRVAGGEDCTTRRIDQGDGTFREEQDCQTRYTDEPVYDDRCSFVVDRWVKAREVRNEGRGIQPIPRWPTPRLRSGTCVGCERAGEKTEVYRVQLQGPGGRSFECELPETIWSGLPVGTSRRLRVGVLTGSPSCQDLAGGRGR